MSGGLSSEQVRLRRRKRGIRHCILVSESNSCRSAYRFLKAFFIPCLDELHLITAVNAESGRASALARQRELVEAEVMECSHYHVVVKEEEYSLFETLGRYITSTVKPHIIFMGSTNLCTGGHSMGGGGGGGGGAGPRASIGPSSGTAATPRPGAQQLRRTSTIGRNGAPAAGAAPSLAPMSTGSSLGGGLGPLGASCLALRVLPELRCAPVLLAKYNTRGPWLNAAASSPYTMSSLASPSPLSSSSSPGLTSSPSMGRSPFPGSRPSSAAVSRSTSTITSQGGAGGGGGAGLQSPSSASQVSLSPGSSMGWPMRVMVDLQPNSRHVLEWLFEHFTPGHDHLFLTVSQAFDGQHNVKPAAQRLLTAFGVQAAVNSFEADKSVLSGPANKSLPQAVIEAEPDVLVLQTPRCKGLPPTIVELLYLAKTSFLIWPPDYTPPLQ